MRRATALVLSAALLAACGSTPKATPDEPSSPSTASAPAEERTERYQVLREEIAALLNKPWRDQERLGNAIDEAASLARTDAQRAEVAAWQASTKADQAALARYEAALKILNARQVDRYREAQEILRSISSKALIHPDAQAYADWIDADLLVRSAATDYDRGDVATALVKLEKAEAFEVLGPDARDSVRERRRFWVQATRSCRDALTALKENRAKDAREAFAAVLAGEQRKRAIHDVARAYLEHMDGKIEDVPETAVAYGETLLGLDPKILGPPRSVSRLVARLRLPSGEPVLGSVDFVIMRGTRGSGTTAQLDAGGTLTLPLQPGGPRPTEVVLSVAGHEDVRIDVRDLARGADRKVTIDLVRRK